MQKLELSFRTKSIEVSIEGESGDAQSFLLKEMPAAERDKHIDDLRSRIGTLPDGSQDVVRYEKLQAGLISKCLFRATPEGRYDRVKIEEIQSWPCTLVQALYLQAQSINGLGEEAKKEKEEAKNG